MKTVKIVLEQSRDKTENRFSIVPGNEDRGEVILNAGSATMLHENVNIVLSSIKDNGTASFDSPNYKHDGYYMKYEAIKDFEELTKYMV